MRAAPSWAVTLASVALVAAAWYGATRAGLVRDLFLPGPADLWDGFVELVQDGYKGRPLWLHVGMSLFRVLSGFLAGAIVGTALGLGMGTLPKLDALAAPFVEFLRPLPQLAYLVLLIVWLGIGETSKITMLFLAALPVSAIAARDGVANVPPEHARQRRRLRIQPGRIRHADAELVVRPAGGDLGVGAGIHVRVDAQRHVHHAPGAGGHGRYHRQLRRALDVDLRDAGLRGQQQLRRRLAHAGEHDAAGRHPRLHRPAQLPAAHHVRPGPAIRHEAQHGKVVVRLHRVVHVRAHPGQRRPQRGQAGTQRARRYHPARRAEVGGDGGERHPLHQQAVEGVHPEHGPAGEQVLQARVAVRTRVGEGCHPPQLRSGAGVNQGCGEAATPGHRHRAATARHDPGCDGR